MTKLDRLITELCPDGVEYVPLGEVCKFQNGFAFKSSLFQNAGRPILRISNIQGDRIDINNPIYFEKNDYTCSFAPNPA